MRGSASPSLISLIRGGALSSGCTERAPTTWQPRVTMLPPVTIFTPDTITGGIPGKRIYRCWISETSKIFCSK